MKRFFCILLALGLLLAGCAGNAPAPTDPPEADPTEPQMKMVWVRTSQTTQTQGLTNRTELIYDANDRVTEAAVFVNEAETARYTVECDENGNFIRWTSHEEVQEYVYDAAGNLLRYETFKNGDLATGYTFTYDAAGNRISQELRIQRLGVAQRTDYLYDDQGRNIRQEVYLDGKLTRTADCVCDDQGRILTMEGRAADGTLEHITEYAYEGGVETRVSRTPEGEVIQTILIIRDSWDNIIRTESYSGTGALLVTEITAWKLIAVPADCPRASI